MTASKNIVYMFAALIPVTLVYSQDTPSFPHIPGIPHLPGIPSIPGIPNIPSIPFLSGQRESPVSGPSEGSTTDPSNQGPGRQDRFFFSLIPILTTCDSATESGRTCRSCSQTLNCLSNNVGLLRKCHGMLRFCNNGICSQFPGETCSTTTTSTSTTSTTTTTTTPTP